MNPKKKRLTCPDLTATHVRTPDANSAPSTSGELTKNQREELLDEAAHYLLSKMSPGTQFQYALDRMIQLCVHYTNDELQDILKKPVKTPGRGFNK